MRKHPDPVPPLPLQAPFGSQLPHSYRGSGPSLLQFQNPPGGARGRRGLRWKRDGSGTCAAGRRGSVREEKYPPGVTASSRLWEPGGEQRRGRGPLGVRAAPDPPLPETPGRRPGERCGWPRALRSPFPLRPPRADGFRNFRSGGCKPGGTWASRCAAAPLGWGLRGWDRAGSPSVHGLPFSGPLFLVGRRGPTLGTLRRRQRGNSRGKGGCLCALFRLKGVYL